MSTALKCESYIFDPRPNYPLLLTAKRYWSSTTSSTETAGYTLVFAHATGFQKEQYEPTIEDLYRLLPPHVFIQEAWSVDAPNSGEAADLNEEYLRWGYDSTFGWQEYARGLHALLTGLGTGVDVDFAKRRLILVGHSFGAVAQVLALTFQPQIQPEQLILLEITCYRPEDPRSKVNYLAEGSEKRRDIWPSNEAALSQFQSRPPWKLWDPRALQLFVEHGLRPLPSIEYPDKQGVTLRCTRRQETATYRDPHGIATTYNTIGRLSKRVPIHLVYGSIANHIPRPMINDFLDNGIGRENIASLRHIDGAGHLIIQTHPTECAGVILDILKQGQQSARL
ncbi:AB hydrolase-1 domain-containing protein [Mycena indigotica]|uniref:AB hydrolase-1 domain-containing protein n=1 Tax=Mycena indigotica TaxID=2126181 RepID=A0A8H6T446_9AGAR|nr:AB hydrolase-1 domain-containing protein [Mycena indigotica]KAF7309567.1 AB hydrolase-1 domain-containing protein [Mycena indigotica]